MKEVLLVNDMPGVGKVALSAMIPILSTMEVKLNYLPTAMISNNFGYGDAVIHDLTDYMNDTQKMWKKHGFEFDIITTGILLSKEQAKMVEKVINNQQKTPIVITDPIMGDDGKLYPGLSEELIDAMRYMVPLADIIVPNLTEAGLILGEEFPEKMTHELIENWIHKLKNIGCKSIIITSVEIENRHYVYGYSYDKDEIFKVEYEWIPVHFGGTGDIFASLITGQIATGNDLKLAVENAVQTLSIIIEQEADQKESPVAEIPIENYLKEIEEIKNL